ncbi:dTDP-4-dehydrorhamnose reductase [Streptomyces sp. NPDC059152]|uniref:dTDP-4-dehydrorhamnose reductase n=1 Tax=Streptomyces sp. NPDC059152 TaxID=3346742 RepID=UPI0036841504
MLGRECLAVLRAAGQQVTGLDRTALDVTDPGSVHAAVRAHRPATVLNCAAWTAVDAAERHEARARRINGDGPAHLADACHHHGARLLHLSTEYVFPGDATTPYAEDAPTAPVNAYGRGKLAGERAVLARLPDTGYVVRTTWLYAGHGHNFVRTMRRLQAERDHVDVVDDQHGQPTWTRDLARQLLLLGRAAHTGRAPAGIYHATSTGATTWYGLARAVFALTGADPDRVHPTGTARLAQPAPRPAYGVLGHDRWRATGLPALPHWHDALARSLHGTAG